MPVFPCAFPLKDDSVSVSSQGISAIGVAADDRRRLSVYDRAAQAP
jgi:hypothetical protein